MMLLDILMALSLAAVFVSGMTAASIEAREVFERAKTRADLIQAYVVHQTEFASLLPYESRVESYPYGFTSTDSTAASSTIMIKANARWYGNDRIETDITSSYGSTSISFMAIREYPLPSIDDAAGTPLCSPDLSSNNEVGSYDYDYPAKLDISISITPIALPIDPLLPLTDLVIRDDIAYISTDSSKSSDPDLIIADISNPNHPKIISELDTGPGLSALTIAGKYVYAAAASTAAELHVIRLDSLASPILAKKYRLPLPQSSTTPPTGTAIFYDKNKIYLGTNKWDGDEFSVIDVSVPENPSKIGGYEIGSKVNSIYVRDSIAYIAAPSQMQLRALSVADSAHPYLMNAFSPSGWQRQEGNKVSYFEGALSFGRTSGGYDIPTDHELFNWPPASSTPDISKDQGSANVPGGIYGIVADRDHVYVATRTVDQELSIYDESLSTSTARYYSLPVAPQTITCDGRKIYILAHTAPVIYEITSTQT